MKINFLTHADLVAACEQLTDDMVCFTVNPCELEIMLINGYVPHATVQWLREVSVDMKPVELWGATG